MKKVLIEAELFLRLALSPGQKFEKERCRAGALGKISQEQRNQDSWSLDLRVLLGFFVFLGFFSPFPAEKTHDGLGSGWGCKGTGVGGAPGGWEASISEDD